MKKNRYLLSEKMVIIINGKGGVGKDTLCNASKNYFFSEMVSAITPIKELAKSCGWKGDKSAKSRKFLSDLKRLLIEYNDLPNNYLISKYHDFLMSTNDILFVQIRESDQIEAFCEKLTTHYFTLLVKSNRNNFEKKQLGNISDDAVDDYSYDYTYWNDAPLDGVGDSFFSFLVNTFKEEGVLVNEKN